MKLLCCNKAVFLLLFLYSSVFGSLNDKSAILYYGDDISYSMVGIHDYIIVQPDLINTYEHGFSIYQDKIYAYVSIGEIHTDIKEYAKIKNEWIVSENAAWNSKVLDIKNQEYQEFLFKEMIEPKLKDGFKNFFFDTLDSYQLYSKTSADRKINEQELANFINNFHKKYPDAKLIINRGFEVMDRVHSSVEAVLFESYHFGLSGRELDYTKVSKSDKKWLDKHISKIQSYELPIIAVDYLKDQDISKVDEAIQTIKDKGMIPYISNKELNIYGKSSKNAIKREIFVLIDESQEDRVTLPAHYYGATPLEYLGYMQKLYDINQGLPDVNRLKHYAGVIIWLTENYEYPQQLVEWVLELQKSKVKVVFASNFGFPSDSSALTPLGISAKLIDETILSKKNVIYQDEMIGFDIEPVIHENIYIKQEGGQALLSVENENLKSTPAAIMPWGGYAVDESFMISINEENLWVIDPFKFFIKALRLKKLIVPDVTTENGNRLLFTHIDGDGIMNRVEWDPTLFSGETILNDILKEYDIPHSVSVIGAEIDPNGLYPKLSNKLIKIVKDIYSLENVEAATHTFSHPYIWRKIKDGNLSEEYRLKVNGYNFSLDKELSKTLQTINDNYLPVDKKKAISVFWSGDCVPTQEVLKYTYSKNILNINGGATIITNTSPWLSNISPLALERGDYYQVYTGAQNENIYTNDWLGPFWGFKKVVQTFKLTDSPRRFKPIDIYYHLYSGSKKASLNALKYVFNWAIEQEVMPIYTSEYIPKVMDYYTVSIAQDKDRWLLDGMNSIRTVRIKDSTSAIDFNNSTGVIGFKNINDNRYLHLDDSKRQFISLLETDKFEKAYLIDANAKVIKNSSQNNNLNISLKGYVDLKLSLYVPKGCQIESIPKAHKIKEDNEIKYLSYKSAKEVYINVQCR